LKRTKKATKRETRSHSVQVAYRRQANLGGAVCVGAERNKTKG